MYDMDGSSRVETGINTNYMYIEIDTYMDIYIDIYVCL